MEILADKNILNEQEIISCLDEELRVEREINLKTKKYLLFLENLLEENNIPGDYYKIGQKKEAKNNTNKSNQRLNIKYDELVKKNKRIERENIFLKKEIENYKNKILVYENSNSWRVTKPLRYLMRLIKK